MKIFYLPYEKAELSLPDFLASQCEKDIFEAPSSILKSSFPVRRYGVFSYIWIDAKAQ